MSLGAVNQTGFLARCLGVIMLYCKSCHIGPCGDGPIYRLCDKWNKRDISRQGVSKMTDINTGAYVVRLTADAEVRRVGDHDLTSMRCAFSHDVKRGDKWEEVANFIDAEAWGKRYASLAKYLVKGTMIVIQASLRQDRWTSEDGTKRSKHKLIVSDIQIARTPEPKQPTLPATDTEDDAPF